MSRSWCACALTILAATACGGDDGPCDPVAATGCDDGQVCEAVTDAEPACFGPVVITGRAFDLTDDGAIAGARLVALDANGAPAGAVAVSETDGEYAIRIPTARAADGTPAGGSSVTLRADAAGYLSFPAGVRAALPIDTTAPVAEGGRYVVRSAEDRAHERGLVGGVCAAGFA